MEWTHGWCRGLGGRSRAWILKILRQSLFPACGIYFRAGSGKNENSIPRRTESAKVPMFQFSPWKWLVVIGPLVNACPWTYAVGKWTVLSSTRLSKERSEDGELWARRSRQCTAGAAAIGQSMPSTPSMRSLCSADTALHTRMCPTPHTGGRATCYDAIGRNVVRAAAP